jgi:glucose uptake protein
MICWGSWANTQKLVGKWRFELFYFDYSFGVLLTAIIAAFTFGSMNSNEISVMDSFALSSYRNIGYGLAGGVIFNLANMLLVSAIAVSGLAVAFPIGIGLALVIGVILNYILNPQGNPVLLFGGAAIVVAAIVVDAMAYRIHERNRQPVAAMAAAPEPRSAAARTGHSSPARNKGSSSAKGIVLSLIAGVLMGSFYPLVEMGKRGDNGLSPYAIALVFAIAVFLSTFIFNIFFMVAPVQGAPVSIRQYFRGNAKQHVLGVLGGTIWCVGTISNFVASSAPQNVQVGPAISYALGQGATMISALWGLLVWKEFAGATDRVRMMVVAMMALFLVGLTMVAIAPLYAR